MVLQDSTQIL